MQQQLFDSRNSQMTSVTIKRVLCSPSLFCRFILDFCRFMLDLNLLLCLDLTVIVLCFWFFHCVWKFYACIQRNLNISLTYFFLQHFHISQKHTFQLCVKYICTYIHLYIIDIHFIYPTRSTYCWSYVHGCGPRPLFLILPLSYALPPRGKMKQK